MAKSSFPAVTSHETQVLILGSLPGDASLAAAQYYAHPRNQFWRLMTAATGIELAGVSYSERLAALLGAGVGLWDVVKSADRSGSLDGAIRNFEANPLAAFAFSLPNLKTIAFNGAAASKIGRSHLPCDAGFTLISLPSSSPAYTAPFEVKREAWMTLKPCLIPKPSSESVVISAAAIAQSPRRA